MTALHFAAIEGHADVAKVLIQNGVDVNAVDDEKSTALHCICAAHVVLTRCEIFLQLLCFGADIDKKTIDAADADKPASSSDYSPLRSTTDYHTSSRQQHENNFNVKRGETFHVESRTVNLASANLLLEK